jgi:Domain of unknown function (DUF4440)
MQRTIVVLGTLLVILTANAEASDSDALIALDKQWGESILKGDTSVSTKLLADAVVSVDDKGMQGKQAVLANIKAAPAGERYEPTDYKVTFINPDTAIMTHGAKGQAAHYSLHVWSRKGNTWQVVATSLTPAAGSQ